MARCWRRPILPWAECQLSGTTISGECWTTIPAVRMN